MSNLSAPNNQAMAPNTLAVVTSASTSGTWSGVWSDNLNPAINAAASVQFDTELATSVTFGNCRRTLRLASATASASPYFAVTAEVPVQTNCPRNTSASAGAELGDLH
jgi:hypothetical protein